MAPIAWEDGPQPIGNVELMPEEAMLAVHLSDPDVDPASLIASVADGNPIFGTPQKSPEPNLVLIPILGKAAAAGLEDQDAELLRALQDEHGEALFAHAVRLSGGDRQRAEDLVQETLLRAWRYPEALDPERGAVRSWLFTTARNLAIDAWRRRSVRVGEVVTDMIPEPPPSADEADRAVEAWTVAEALGRLSASHREVLVECFYQGRSVAEAAARLGIPPGTVKSRTHYALRSLRMVLDEMGVTG
jgi:RNA polymerase sigma-70 factor (ECF subfamily)